MFFVLWRVAASEEKIVPEAEISRCRGLSKQTAGLQNLAAECNSLGLHPYLSQLGVRFKGSNTERSSRTESISFFIPNFKLPSPSYIKLSSNWLYCQ